MMSGMDSTLWRRLVTPITFLLLSMGLSLQASNSKNSQEGRTADDFPNLLKEMKMGTAMIEEHIEVIQIIRSRVII